MIDIRLCPTKSLLIRKTCVTAISPLKTKQFDFKKGPQFVWPLPSLTYYRLLYHLKLGWKPAGCIRAVVGTFFILSSGQQCLQQQWNYDWNVVWLWTCTKQNSDPTPGIVTNQTKVSSMRLFDAKTTASTWKMFCKASHSFLEENAQKSAEEN